MTARLPLEPGRCTWCSATGLVFARMRRPPRQRGRRHFSVLVERCEPGAGDMSLTDELLQELPGGLAPIAEPATGTAWRLHQPHCEGLKDFEKRFAKLAGERT